MFINYQDTVTNTQKSPAKAPRIVATNPLLGAIRKLISAVAALAFQPSWVLWLDLPAQFLYASQMTENWCSYDAHIWAHVQTQT
jgi:hypothetical protein